MHGGNAGGIGGGSGEEGGSSSADGSANSSARQTPIPSVDPSGEGSEGDVAMDDLYSPNHVGESISAVL